LILLRQKVLTPLIRDAQHRRDNLLLVSIERYHLGLLAFKHGILVLDVERKHESAEGFVAKVECRAIELI